MKSKITLLLNITFGISLLLIIVVSYLSYNTINQLVENSVKVNETRETLLHYETIISIIKDAETAQRGYLLTKNDIFLEPYLGAYEKAIKEHDSVRIKLSGNPVQAKRLDSLKTLIDQRFTELQGRMEVDSLEEMDEEVDKTAFIIKGKFIMDEIRDLMQQLTEEETRVLPAQTQSFETASTKSMLTITGYSILAILLLLSAYFAIRKELQRRQQLELELQQNNQELNRSNAELEQFAYVASHDLQEPLRKVRAFGDLLKIDYEDQLDETGKGYISRMQNAAGRMQNLINALLNFSRASRHKGELEEIDLNELIEQILADLEIVIKEKNAELEIDIPTGTVIQGISIQVQQLFQNLISNSLKFSKPDVPPVLQIKVREAKEADIPKDIPHLPGKEYLIFTLQDNGIGFDENYLDRIFTIFQRLHGKSSYQGTGIGLALCRRIAQNHGGYITARSKEGEGSTFYVTLPNKIS